jgi:predicted dehydrogenase
VRKFPELFEVIGYAEENERWIEKRGGLRGYAGLPRLSAQEIIERSDAVLIECDVWDLTKYARACVDAGKHIHMDKPASGTLAEYKALLDTAKEKGLTVQLGYMYRYNPAVQKTLAHIKNGDLGEIYSINAEMSTYHSPAYKRWLTNFGGGIFYILGSHLVDLAVYILGEPKGITAFMKQTGQDGVEFPDNDLAVLEYDKALARIFVSSVEVNGWGRRQLVVSGSRGTVNICPLENECYMTYSDTALATNPYEDMKKTVDVKDLPKSDRYDEMMRDFHAYIVGEKENPFSYEHDYRVQKVLDKIVGGVRIYGKHID